MWKWHMFFFLPLWISINTFWAWLILSQYTCEYRYIDNMESILITTPCLGFWLVSCLVVSRNIATCEWLRPPVIAISFPFRAGGHKATHRNCQDTWQECVCCTEKRCQPQDGWDQTHWGGGGSYIISTLCPCVSHCGRVPYDKSQF